MFPSWCCRVLIVLLLGLASRADASFSIGPYSLSGNDAGSNFSLTIPQYNPAIYGPLQSVTFSFVTLTNTLATYSFENLASQAILFNFDPYYGFDIKTTNFEVPPFPPFPAIPTFPTPNIPLSAYKGTENFTGSDSTTLQAGIITDSTSQTYIYSGSPKLADYVGTGTVTLQIAGSLMIHETSTLSGSLPAYELLTAGTFASSFTVTYNSVVPEPASVVMVGLGSLLVLAGGWARRRPGMLTARSAG